MKRFSFVFFSVVFFLWFVWVIHWFLYRNTAVVGHFSCIQPRQSSFRALFGDEVTFGAFFGWWGHFQSSFRAFFGGWGQFQSSFRAGFRVLGQLQSSFRKLFEDGVTFRAISEGRRRSSSECALDSFQCRFPSKSGAVSEPLLIG